MRIGRYPQGYLELLDAKSNGSTPPDAAEFVQPVVDVTAHYSLGIQRSALGATGSLSATGLFVVGAALTVPNGEIWRVRQVNVETVNLAASTAYRLRPAISNTGLTNMSLLGPASSSAIATERIGVGWDPDDLLLGPGWAFGCLVEAVTLGTANTATIRVLYDRMTA
jgi:hypothetical protein